MKNMIKGMAFAALVVVSSNTYAKSITKADCKSESKMKRAAKKIKVSLQAVKNACAAAAKEEQVAVSSLSPADEFAQRANSTLCIDDEARVSLADDVGIDPMEAVIICRNIVRDVAKNIKNPGNADNPFEGLSNFLKDISLERNPKAITTRTKFGGAFAPGIDTIDFSAPFPWEVFEDQAYSCETVEPFRGVGTNGTTRPSFFEFRVQETGPGTDLWVDSDGFQYGTVGGVPLREFSGADTDNYRIRSIRVEPYCRISSANPTRECEFLVDGEKGYDSLNLIIEESVQGQGLLSFLGSWFANAGGLLADAEDLARDYFRSRAGKALNFWTDNNCTGSQLLTGCEMAAAYYVCTPKSTDDGDF